MYRAPLGRHFTARQARMKRTSLDAAVNIRLD
jgi:hypothetical protein